MSLIDKKVLISIAVVVVVLAVGAVLFFKGSQNSTSQDQSTTSQVTEQNATPTNNPTDSAVVASDSGSDKTSKEFTVTGSSFKFVPATLSANKGDHLKITFKNSGGFHDFVIDEFNVKSKTIGSGAEEVLEFTADKSGTFNYYCSVGNHRAMGMQGTLTVN